MGKNHASQYANFGSLHECSIKKNNVFVSSEALSLLNDGWRLTYNYNAPCDKDFK